MIILNCDLPNIPYMNALCSSFENEHRDSDGDWIERDSTFGVPT